MGMPAPAARTKGEPVRAAAVPRPPAGGVKASPTDPDVVVLPAPGAPAGSSASEQRILEAALRLVARWGVAKTTIADIAHEAGCGRATVYRLFPGGKREVFEAVGRAEFASLFGLLLRAIDEADDLEDALTRMITCAADTLDHHAALQFLLAHEPGVVLPFLGFNQVDRLYMRIRRTLGPPLERFVADPEMAAWAAEWAARLVLTVELDVDPPADLALEPAARSLVRRFLVPALSPPLAAHTP